MGSDWRNGGLILEELRGLGVAAALPWRDMSSDEAEPDAAKKPEETKETNEQRLRDGGFDLACPTIGSEAHAKNACKPCSFWRRYRCDNGKDCSHCHLFHAKVKHPGKKVRDRMKRDAEQKKLVAEGGTDKPVQNPHVANGGNSAKRQRREQESSPVCAHCITTVPAAIGQNICPICRRSHLVPPPAKQELGYGPRLARPP